MAEHTDPWFLVGSLVKKELPGDNLKFLKDDLDNLDIRQSGEGGCLNHIFTVRSADGKSSVVIKHGTEVPLAEALSCSSLPIERQELEFECLKMLHNIRPGCVPQPYHLDKELHLILMEDLGAMDLLRPRLRIGDFDDKVAAEIGRIMAEMQCKTHKKVVSPDTWREYQSKLSHRGMRETAILWHTDYVLEGGPLLEVREEFSSHVKEWSKEIRTTKMFEKLREKFHREDCFVHLDLHHQSTFVKEGRVAVFDLEFGGLGNQAYAIGYLFAFCTFSLVEAQEKLKDKRDSIRDSFFISGFGDLVDALGPIPSFVSEMSEFMGNTLFCFALCSSHATFFTINPIQRRRLAELGMELMRHQKKHNSIEELIETIFSYV